MLQRRAGGVAFDVAEETDGQAGAVRQFLERDIVAFTDELDLSADHIRSVLP